MSILPAPKGVGPAFITHACVGASLIRLLNCQMTVDSVVASHGPIVRLLYSASDPTSDEQMKDQLENTWVIKVSGIYAVFE